MRTSVLVGDIHGQFNVLCDQNLADCDVYQVGDFGLGFGTKHSDHLQMKHLNRFAQKHNINFFAIRGNHDNPVFWQEPEMNKNFNEQYSNIKLIPDYTYKTIAGKKVLFIGGATSIDRKQRVQGLSYWRDESLAEPTSALDKCDIVISHTCPSRFPVTPTEKDSIVDYYARFDSHLYSDIKREREIMDRIMDEVSPNEWYFGHFHLARADQTDGVLWRCINIDEKLGINWSFYQSALSSFLVDYISEEK